MAPSQARTRLLAVLLAAVVAGCGGGSPAPDRTVNESPEARATVPAPVERAVHAGLHALPRAYRRGSSGRATLRRTTRSFIRYYRQYPSNRYGLRIDDESGTMLSALLVLRQELLGCDRALATEIEAVLPRDLQRGRPRRGRPERG